MAEGIAIAVTLGGGAMLLEAQRTNAVQDSILSSHTTVLESREKAINDLTNAISNLNSNVAVLNSRINTLK